jgi:predicted dehydrogenase
MTRKEYNITRRELIQGMSAIAGSTLLANSLPWISVLNAQTAARVSASDKVNLAIIGPGDRGTYLMKLLFKIPSANIVAVCDDYPPYLQRAVEMTGGKAAGYADYHAMLERKDINGVIIATPLHLHTRMCLDCFDAGLHVFCEKALTKTIDEALVLEQAQKKTGRILQTGHQRMFDIRYLKAFEAMKSGKLGKITQIRAFWHRNNNWRRPVPSPELERKINWRLYREYSLGLMTELASHHLQVTNWFLESAPLSCMGSGSINYWQDGREVYDNVNVIYRYPNGVHVVYDSMISNRRHGLEIQILGDKGGYDLEAGKFYSEQPPTPPGILQLINDVEHKIFDPLPLGGSSWVPETAMDYKGDWIVNKRLKDFPNETGLSLEAFIESIRTDKPIAGMAEQGIDASIACILGDTAMQRNEIIDFSKEVKR